MLILFISSGGQRIIPGSVVEVTDGNIQRTMRYGGSKPGLLHEKHLLNPMSTYSPGQIPFFFNLGKKRKHNPTTTMFWPVNCHFFSFAHEGFGFLLKLPLRIAPQKVLHIWRVRRPTCLPVISTRVLPASLGGMRHSSQRNDPSPPCHEHRSSWQRLKGQDSSLLLAALLQSPGLWNKACAFQKMQETRG